MKSANPVQMAVTIDVRTPGVTPDTSCSELLKNAYAFLYRWMCSEQRTQRKSLFILFKLRILNEHLGNILPFYRFNGRVSRHLP
jgi:hypothetical protein